MSQSSAPHPSGDEPSARPALVCAAAHARFWIPAGLVVLIDLWSKRWAFSNLPAEGSHPWIPGLIEFRRSLNDGAVFGSFTGYVGVFIVASVLALAFVLYMFAHSDGRQRALHVALALVLAGAVGNLYDRAFVQAHVVKRLDAPEQGSIVGIVLSEAGDSHVRVGEWPDGSHVRKYPRDQVSVRQQGVVRDFIKFTPRFPGQWAWVGGQDVWPWVFNIADAALVCGVALLILTSLFDRHAEAAVRAPGASAGP